METTTVSVSSYLKEKLQKHQKLNKSYSLRAFAAKLGLSPGGLAQILSGKKKLSQERAHSIVGALKLSTEEKNLFLLAVEFEQAKSAQRKAEIFESIKKLDQKTTADFFDLNIDQFKLISDWYGLAILECVSSYGQCFDARKVAKHFGITSNDASLTLERLVRLELIEFSDGKWKRLRDRVLVTSTSLNEAITNYYKSVTTLSYDSYSTQNAQERISGTEVFAFDQEQLEEARKFTYDYLNKLQKLSKSGKKRNCTYQAIINIFQISKNIAKDLE